MKAIGTQLVGKLRKDRTTSAGQEGWNERKPRALVFDIGGTNTRGATYDLELGTLRCQRRAATPNFLRSPAMGSSELLDNVVGVVRQLAEDLLSGEQPDIVVVGYPGPITPSGIAVRSPTILGTTDDTPADMRRWLETLWPGATVTVLNDLTCSGYAYVDAGHRNFCLLTVSSGIGNKVFLNGEPIVGELGHGGEIGHLSVELRAESPLADVRGELGELASGRGVVRLARIWAERRIDEWSHSLLGSLADFNAQAIDGYLLAEAFRSGDALSRAILEEASYPLAGAIGSIHLSIGIETFFVIGGFAKALGPDYIRLLAELASRTTWDMGQDWHGMIHLGNESEEEGLIGSGRYAASLWETVRYQ